MSLNQSLRFEYRGLVFDIQVISHTQSTYTVSSPLGERLAGPFDAEAPYNPEKLLHVAYDGRVNEWRKTDKEIVDAFESFLAKGADFGHPVSINKIKSILK